MANTDHNPLPTPSSELSFSSDGAVSSKEEDALGRYRFAQVLAKAIRSRQGEESFVISLMGPWGCGKTSVKNMALKSLRENEETCPFIVEFDPWLWSDVPTLSAALFQAIAFALPQPEQEKSAETKESAGKRLELWKKYQRISTVSGVALKSAGTLALFSGHPLVAAAFSGLSRGATDSAEAMKVAIDEAQSIKEDTETDVSELRKQLEESMRSLERPVVVVLDDIERLSAPEIATVFQLVKANLNFPNLVYLLLFQRESVEASLSDLANGQGRGFLEKIVQMPLEVPMADQRVVRSELLNRIIKKFDHADEVDSSRLNNILDSGLSPLFETMRDVQRFINALSFVIAALRDEATGELPVDAVDLVALESLRFFEPDVYALITSHKGVLTSARSLSHRNESFENAQKSVTVSLIESASETNRPHVQTILSYLFPVIRWVWQGNNLFESAPGRIEARERRVCHPLLFNRYFQLMVDAESLSLSEERSLLEKVNDRAGLVELLEDFARRNLLRDALSYLITFADRIPPSATTPLLTALCDIADTFPDQPVTYYMLRSLEGIAYYLTQLVFQRGREFHDYELHIRRLYGDTLTLEKLRSLRKIEFHQVIEGTTGFFLPVFIVAADGDHEFRDEFDQKKTIFNREDIPALRKACVPLLQRAAKEGRLWDGKGSTLMWRCWIEWDESSAQEYISRALEEENAIFSIISNALSYTLNDRMVVNLPIALKFAPLEILDEYVNRVRSSKLSKEESALVALFDDAFINYQQQTQTTESKSEEDTHAPVENQELEELSDS